jgi:hypothetical protein
VKFASWQCDLPHSTFGKKNTSIGTADILACLGFNHLAHVPEIKNLLKGTGQ